MKNEQKINRNKRSKTKLKVENIFTYMFLSIIDWLSWWLWWCEILSFLSEFEKNEFMVVSCVDLAKEADCVVSSGVKIGWGTLSWWL